MVEPGRSAVARRACVRTVHHARGASAADALSRSHSLARSHVRCTQAIAVAVSGSYAYVAAYHSNSLVVVDISNPASLVIRGSVVSSSLLNGVRVALSFAHHACPRGASAADVLSRSHLLVLTCCAHTGSCPRCERLVRLRRGVSW